MFFNKTPRWSTPMEQFLHRADLTQDERAVLDVYLTGLIQGLDAMNQVFTANGKTAIFSTDMAVDAKVLEELIDAFLAERVDMKTQPLNLCAVMAVMQRYPA
jgi:hypothetical protein